ncbi:MAG: biopolymer transporter ExbD [Polyangiaceae bacterium]
MAGSSSNDSDDGMVSGINVTPLVDITLVLLIIFMVTARIIVSQSLPMDLPKAAQGQQIQLVFGVELHSDGSILVDSKRLANDDAVFPVAKEAFAKNSDLRAVIRADTAVQHGRVIRVLDLLKQAGISKIAFGVSAVPPEPGAVAAPDAPAPTPVEVKP